MKGSQGLGNLLGQWGLVNPLLWQVYPGYGDGGRFPKDGICFMFAYDYMLVQRLLPQHGRTDLVAVSPGGAAFRRSFSDNHFL